MYIYLYICVYICIHVYICVYMCIYVYIYSEIAQRCLPSFVSARLFELATMVPTRPARARSTHFDRLWRFDLPRSANFDRLGRLDAARTTHFDRLCIDFAVDFHRFSREDRATYSTCSAMYRTFDFAGRRGTSEGWHARQQRRKATHFNERSLQQCFANERCVRTLAFCRSSTPLGADFGHLGAPLDAPGRSPRASSTNLCRLDRPRSTHFDRLGRLGEPQAIHFGRLGRFDRPCAGPNDVPWPDRSGRLDLAPSIWPHRHSITISLSTSLHRTFCNDLHASSQPCLVSSIYIYIYIYINTHIYIYI